MTADDLVRLAVINMGLVPTPEQGRVIGALAQFAVAREPLDALIINGYAGTGKTTVIGAMVAAMKSLGQKTVLLAPTGRAAKVASGFSGGKTRTVHKYIYRMLDSDAASTSRTFVLGTNYDSDTIYFVDEASMITHNKEGNSLLLDLLRFVYGTRRRNSIVFIGDTAQLPPVGQQDSLAMVPDVLRNMGLNPYLFLLDQPLRQALDSGILYNATLVRRALEKNAAFPPTLKASRFEDVKVISSEELADMISDSWAKVGREETLLITRSNYRANRYNEEIRRRVLYSESPLEQGERLIIAKNNYFWTKEDKTTDFLANGEIAIVDWVGKPEKQYGRFFMDVEIHLQGHEETIGAKVMLRSLKAEGPAIPKEEMDRFYARVMAEYEGELTEKMKSVDEDPYFNALQVKYAYCVTCHKAQGGQWRHVYIDLGGIAKEAMDATFYRWLYTAMTRATDTLYLINPTLTTE